LSKRGGREVFRKSAGPPLTKPINGNGIIPEFVKYGWFGVGPCTVARAACLSLALVGAGVAMAGEPFTGRVVRVHDGDTITVERAGGERGRVRLWEIDCPEGDQPWGDRATDFTTERCLDKRVLVLGRDEDRYDRLVAEVMLPSQRIINYLLLQEGLVWWYEKYAPDETLYRSLEKHARRHKKGLWADPEPVPPWDWRKRIKAVEALPAAESKPQVGVNYFKASQ